MIAQTLNASVSDGGWKVTPRGRGVTAAWVGGFETRVEGRVTIDAEGVVGARLGRGRGTGEISLRSLESQYIRPLVRGVAELLRRAELHGRGVWRLDVGLPPQDFQVVGVERMPRRPFFAFGEASSPPSPEEEGELTQSWLNQLAREMGVESRG
jgi:hypothetical protein